MVVGPTASGKTDLARRLAIKYGGEIVSADSRQVYKRLDIGTGKDGVLQTNQTKSPYLGEQYSKVRYIDTVPQWLTDFMEPTESFTVVEYQKRASEVINDILSRNKLPIITGGTGLYVTALIEGYQFKENRGRYIQSPRHVGGPYQKDPPNWNVKCIGIDIPREELYKRIDKRLDDRMKVGLVKEARQLIDSGLSFSRLRQLGLEYKYLADLLEGNINQDKFVNQLRSAIHAFARRQLTWWRHHGNINWVKDATEAQKITRNFLTQ